MCQNAHRKACNRPADRLALDRRQGNPPRHNMKAKPMTVPANARILSAVVATAKEAAKPAPAKELEWTQLDPSTLSPDLRKAYDAYKDAARHANTLREAFERQMTVAIDPLDSEKVVFGYRFGKLSLAIAPADKPRKPSAAVSLADFIGKR